MNKSIQGDFQICISVPLKSLVSKGQWMVVEYKLGTFCFIYLFILISYFLKET